VRQLLTGSTAPRKAPWRTALLISTAVVLAACSTTSNQTSKSSSGGKILAGGVAVMAENPQGAPNDIFPFLGPTTISNANVSDFNALMYLPLYWFGGSGGSDNSVTLNTQKSLAYPPVYSNGNKTVTISLKRYKWSDGTPVTSASVIFFMEIAKANKDQWGLYEPGHLPDNVATFQAHGPLQVVFNLTEPVNPAWFTANQLNEITPLPQEAWDKTSISGKVGDYAATAKGSRQVYSFLASQASKLATYDTNPLWKVVDGPWSLSSFDDTGNLTFVPNRAYSGPDRPHLSEFKEVPFTADSAEFNVLLAGGAINVGYLPTEDLSQQGRLTSSGYALVKSELSQINFLVLNYNNPSIGPLVRQLYIRQALQHVMDEQGQLKALLGGNAGGYAVYGPIPPKPPSPYMSDTQTPDPDPFSINAARELLTSHGWKIPSSGPAVCVKPGNGPQNCGADIPAGKSLSFTLLYVSGSTYLQEEMADFKSDAGQAGIVFSQSSAPFNTVTSRVIGTCPAQSNQAACDWQVGTWGAGFSASLDAYPSGELIFPNLTGYTNATLQGLINATVQSSSPTALAKYSQYVSNLLPVIWQIATYNLNEVSTNLHGVVFNAIGNINPSDWYFTKS
jgi:peptide/nickel transport system substrate-binding protein